MSMGAIVGGYARTATDARGLGGLWFQALRTVLDFRGPGLEIYGSEGWGFESLRGAPYDAIPSTSDVGELSRVPWRREATHASFGQSSSNNLPGELCLSQHRAQRAPR
jgi:hypothetical protein